MHILVTQETDWLLRGPHQQHHLLERLAQRGHTATVLDFEIDYRPYPRAPLWAARQTFAAVSRVGVGGSVQVVRPPTVRLPAIARLCSLPAFAWELHKQIRLHRPQVLLNYALSTGSAARWAAAAAKIPFVMHVIDALPTLIPNRWLQPIGRALEYPLLRTAQHSIYINEQLREYGIAHGAVPNHTSTIRTGVDLQKFRPDLDAADLRARWGIHPSDVVLGFIGYLYEFAGLDTILQQLAALPKHVKLLIVGDGPALTSLQQQRAALNLTERVILTGRQPYADMPRYLAASDVCLLYAQVNSIMRDIVPIKTYEYMASGRPVLASPLPGVMRDVPPGNGILYPDLDQLPLTLVALCQPSYRAQLGQAARAFVVQHCDWEILTTQFAERLASVAAAT